MPNSVRCENEKSFGVTRGFWDARPARIFSNWFRNFGLIAMAMIGFLISQIGWIASPARGEEVSEALPDSAPARELLPEQVLDPPPAASVPTVPALPAPAALPTLPQESSEMQLETPVDTLQPARQPRPWRLDIALQSSVTFDDNIFIQHVDRVSDVYFGITPVVALTLGKPLSAADTLTGMVSRFLRPVDPNEPGDSLLLRYAPTATFFVHNTDQNSFDEDVTIDGRLRTEKTLAEFEARYQTLSSPDIDVGNRINRSIYSAYGDVNYSFTDKTSADSRLEFNHTSYEGGLNFTDIGERVTLDYKILPKTSIGVGGLIGYTNVEDGTNQVYEQGLLHFHYIPTHKITIDLIGGVEARQFTSGGSRTTPVFEFNASYAAQESTTILLTVSRKTEPSAIFQGQDVDRTTVEGNIRQLLFQKVYVTLGGGYQHAEYVDAGIIEGTASRTDDYAYFGASAATEITKWCSLRLDYRYQDNRSTDDGFAFRRNVADIQLNVQF